MNATAAHQLLDAVRAGAEFDVLEICEALVATGDLADDDAPVRLSRAAGSWELQSARAGLLRPATPFDGLAS